MPLHVPKIRGDLIYEENPLEEGQFYVKDPVRGDMFSFNELQVAMMRALDGKRTVSDVQKHLAELYDVELPSSAVARFLDRLEKSLLLDVTSYTVDDVRTRKRILAVLRKRKLALRVKARDEASPEAGMFAAATRQLHNGDPCLAASYFEAVLDINPNNERARRVLACIQDAFFKSKIVAPTGIRMWKVWDPDRFLTKLDAKIGRYVFSALGVTVFFLLVVSSIPSIVDVMSRPDKFTGLGLSSVIQIVSVLTLLFAWHEMSHGLACKHYGGHVTDMGVLLMYYVIPGAYCDVSDSYLFRKKRHKIIVQLAGTVGDIAMQCAIWHVLAFTDPTFPLWTALFTVNIILIYDNFRNLVPLVKFDGYYALADYLDLPNLRDRAFAHLKQRLQALVLGIETTPVTEDPRERRILLVYGVLASIYTPAVIYFAFIGFLLPLAMNNLGVVGVVLAVLYMARIVIFTLGRQLVRLVTYIVRQRHIVFTRRRTAAFAGVAVVLAAILSLPWPLYVEGVMEVEPRERAEIRALEPGLVAEIHVDEGERVSAGQLLAVVRNDELERDTLAIEAEVNAAKARLAMLRKGARPEEIAIVRARRRVDETRLTADSQRLDQYRRLRKLEVESEGTILSARARVSSAAGQARVARAEEALVRAGTREQEIEAESASVRRLESVWKAMLVRNERLQLRSPIAGIVVSKRIREQLGRHLVLGDTLMEVHDVHEWRVRIAPYPSESLRGLAPGLHVTASATGDSTSIVNGTLEQVVSQLETREPVVYASMPGHPGWRSGMTGRARILVPRRSIAFRLIALPIIRLVDFDLWRLR